MAQVYLCDWCEEVLDAPYDPFKNIIIVTSYNYLGTFKMKRFHPKCSLQFIDWEHTLYMDIIDMKNKKEE